MAAQQRIEQISTHLTTRPGTMFGSPVGQKCGDDIVVVSALRTAITRAKKGGFKDTLPEELLYHVLKATLDKTGIDPAIVEDIQVGNVLPEMGGAKAARMAQLHAGFPITSSIATTNRQCASGLQAVAGIASAIKSGIIEVGIGAGVESMTHGFGPKGTVLSTESELLCQTPEAKDCLLPMGITSENVAQKFNVTRQAQDRWAAQSQSRAAAAQKGGLFDKEIIPVTTTITDPTTKEKRSITVTKDDGVRENTTVDGLAKLKPSFKPTGSTTAGNASQVSDGAAAVLLMKRSKAQALNLPIMGKLVSYATVGVPPNVMGIGPAYAIPVALQRAGITRDQVDVFEINEAFASQLVYSVEYLGLNHDKVNPKGGAIALGHPLGCTGARLVATLLTELERRKQNIGVVSMCMGTGMGAAAVFESE
ncbi:hypothetical protein SpCBS45565_g07064 [Spizellomyces sp. 'palustris']|nr:hypothetical protein SpCBS45565_g07064 [Spizellomyces sp. 'palustris']